MEFQSSSFQQQEAVPRGAAGDGSVLALATHLSVLLKWVSQSFSLHFDACGREVLGFVNLIPFG